MSDIENQISARAIKLDKCDDQSYQLIQSRYKYLPDEYLEFLSTVGWGEIAGFMLYSAPLELNEIFDEETAAGSPRTVLIGDDYAGWHLGYVETPSGWKMTFFDHSDLPGSPALEGGTLEEFFLSWLSNVQ